VIVETELLANSCAGLAVRVQPDRVLSRLLGHPLAQINAVILQVLRHRVALHLDIDVQACKSMVDRRLNNTRAVDTFDSGLLVPLS
jgi:hypothetical protein